MINVFNCQGTHRDGMAVSTMYFASGGFGALSRRDGLPTMSHSGQQHRRIRRDVGEDDQLGAGKESSGPRFGVVQVRRAEDWARRRN